MSERAAELSVLGTSHAVAPAGVRERMHVDVGEVFTTLARLTDGRLLEEAVPLATCGRLELYMVTERPERALALLSSLMARHTGIPEDELSSHTFHRTGRAAAQHLFRVAAGLDSVVHGEAQVLGQVRDALRHPATPATAGPWLQRLFQSAVASGKRVRTETEIGRGAVSLAGAALGLLGREAGAFDELTAVVLGAGDTGSLIARLLRKQGARRIVIANRTLERAGELAAQVGGEASRLDDLAPLLAEADVVVGTVAEREGLVSLDNVGAADGRARYFLDLAHPRNFDPSIEEVPGVRLMDLDHVFGRVERAREARAQQVPLAEAIVEEEVERYVEWMRSRASTPVLRAIREQVLELARSEADRHARGLHGEEREAVQRFARSFARTLLHQPTVAIRGADPGSAEGRGLLRHAASLFGVDDTDGAPSENGDGSA